MIDKETLELGGRTFVFTADDEVVFAQRAYITSAAKGAGLGDELMSAWMPLIEDVQAGKGMDPAKLNAAAWQVVSRAMESDAYLRVIAGTLVEQGKRWDRADADANCEFFANLTGDDITVLEEVLIAAIMGFIVVGLKSTLISQRSSEVKARLEEAGVDLEKMTVRPKMTPEIAGVPSMESSAK